MQPGREAFGGALQLEQSAGAVVFPRKKGSHQMRAFVGFSALSLVDLMASFENTETVEVLRVFYDVAVDAWKQRRPEKFLACGNRIHDANMIFNREPEPAGFLFADKRIIRNFKK